VGLSQENQKVVRDWILLVCGIVWVSYFAFYNPAAMNPYFMTLGASGLFGPRVLSLWRGDNDKDDTYDPDRKA
jgi:hypothetical protein